MATRTSGAPDKSLHWSLIAAVPMRLGAWQDWQSLSSRPSVQLALFACISRDIRHRVHDGMSFPSRRHEFLVFIS
ncbi:MAG: hypothetical protein ACOYM2_12340 [Rectinemataceae bacterium]